MPAEPTPEIALPTMKDSELGAAPQSADAAENITMLTRRTTLTSYNAYSFPNNSWKAQQVSRYILPYQPTSLSELKSLVILGMAFFNTRD